MANRLGGAFEIIGLRAAMLDVRQYISDGKAIERANESLITSQAKLDAAQARRAAVSKQLAAAQLNVQNTALHLAQAQQAFAIRAQQPQTRIPAGQPGAGRFAPNPLGAVVISSQKAYNQALKEEEGFKRQLISVNKTVASTEQQIAGFQATQIKANEERNRLFAGLVAGAGALAIVAGVTASITAATKFQTTLGKLRTLTEATDQEVQKLGKDFLELSKTVPVSPDELGATAYQVLSSGIKDTGQALEITKLAAEGEAIGLGKASDVARTITQVINAYGKENITAAQAADILGKAAQLGSGDAADFASSLGRVLGIASQAGIKFDELAASVASLTNIGLSAEEAVTAVRGAIQAVLNPSTEARAALLSVHSSIDQLRKGISGGNFVATLQDLIDKFHGNLAAIEPIIPNIRALTGVISAFGVQGKQTANILSEIDKANGFVAESFGKIKDNVGVQSKILKNELTVTLVQLGTVALPAVTKGLQDLNAWINNNQKAIQDFGQNGVKVVFRLFEDLVRGIFVAATGLSTFYNILSSLGGASVAAAAGIGAIGTALVWALPGGPYIKGLITIAALVGEISGGKASPKNLALKSGLVGGGALLGATFGAQALGVGAVPGAIGGAAAGGLIAHALGLDKTSSDAAKSTDILGKAIDKANAAINGVNITLPELNRNLDDSARAAQLDADEILNLEKQFRSQSEAAAEFKNNFDFKNVLDQTALFAEIPKKLADALGLTATQAGNIQGIDALKNAEARASDEAYQLTAALATVAQAFQKDANVANTILLSMASAAQEASQKALSELLGQPTREQANLGTRLAQQNLQKARFTASSGQNLQQLQDALKNLDNQISASQSRAAQQQRQKQASDQAQQAAQQASAQAAADAQNAALDQLKEANALAQAGYDKLQAQLQILIDTNTKSLSDLQEVFLSQNEALQAKINKAVGQGDTAGALALVEQQKKAAADFQAKQKDLTKSTEDLTYQQKQLKDQQSLQQAEAAAAEAQLEATVQNTKSISAGSVATDTNTQSTTDNSTSTDDNTTALENQKASIQASIDSIDNQSNALDNQSKLTQDQLSYLQAQTDLLKAQGVSADQTLKSQATQREEAGKLIGQIFVESGAHKDLADKLHQNTIPSIDTANTKFDELQQALDLAANTGLRETFINRGIDPAQVRLQILAGTAANLNTKLGGTSDVFDKFVKEFGDVSSYRYPADANKKSTSSGIVSSIGNAVGSAISSVGYSHNAYGGMYDRPTLALVGEEYKKEWIVPSGHPQRAKEILSTIPANLLAPLYAKSPSKAIFAPNIMVTGETLDTMEVVALRAVAKAFQDARSTSHRAGSLLTSGIG
jgi:TP901 family phage tail tape measure protein